MGVELLIGSTIASGALGLFGGLQQAQATESQAAFQAAVARNNATIRAANAAQAEQRARIEERNAELTGFAGQERAQRQDFEAARQLGNLRAAQGASGLTGGSQRNLLRSLRQQAADDRQSIRFQSDAQATQFRSRATDFLTQSASETNAAQQILSNTQAELEFARFNANNQRFSAIGGFASDIASAGSTALSQGLFDSPLTSGVDPAVRRFRPSTFGGNFTTSLSF